jgi:hypothetical protein
MIYIASTTRIVEIGDHSDLVIKERQQMGQFFNLISCIQLFRLYDLLFYCFYTYIQCITVLLFFKIAVSPIGKSMSQYQCFVGCSLSKKAPIAFLYL